MSNDYAKGFKDGFAAGLEEGKKLAPKDTVFQPSYLGSFDACRVCGKQWGNDAWGYVCSNMYCPSRAIAYTTGVGGAGGAVIGAVGSMDTMNSGVGANGPEGTISYADWAGNPTNPLSDK